MNKYDTYIRIKVNLRKEGENSKYKILILEIY